MVEGCHLNCVEWWIGRNRKELKVYNSWQTEQLTNSQWQWLSKFCDPEYTGHTPCHWGPNRLCLPFFRGCRLFQLTTLPWNKGFIGLTTKTTHIDENIASLMFSSRTLPPGCSQLVDRLTFDLHFKGFFGADTDSCSVPKQVQTHLNQLQVF